MPTLERGTIEIRQVVVEPEAFAMADGESIPPRIPTAHGMMDSGGNGDGVPPAFHRASPGGEEPRRGTTQSGEVFRASRSAFRKRLHNIHQYIGVLGEPWF